MGGDGTIGGGSCQVQFHIWDKDHGKQSWAGRDCQQGPVKLTITFTLSKPQEEVPEKLEVTLGRGDYINIHWN